MEYWRTCPCCHERLERSSFSVPNLCGGCELREAALRHPELPHQPDARWIVLYNAWRLGTANKSG